MKTSKQKPKAKSKCAGTRRVVRLARERAVQEGRDPKLAECAATIHRLGKRAITDIIEIGRQLTLAKELAGHGHWADWLEEEFDWSEGTALNYMRVYQLAEDRKSKNFMDLRIAPSALYALVRPGTSDEVRNEIIERAEAGESITNKDVQAALQPAADENAPTTEDINNTLHAENEDDDEKQISETTWLGRRLICANKAAGEARIEDWIKFELSAGVMEALRDTAEAWHKLVEYLDQRRTIH